jgi:PhnB protein
MIQGSEWTTGVIVPHLAVRDLDAAVEFYKQALGAVELYRSPRTEEFGEYASLRIWNSTVMISADILNDEKPELELVASPERLGGTTCVFQVCVPDADAVYERAIESGALPAMPLADMFWGDRYGWVRDPFGYLWAICSVNETISAQECNRRMTRKVEAR